MSRPLLFLLGMGLATGCVSNWTVTDFDRDGFTVEMGDCDDTRPKVNPGAGELCDGLDNDCDTVVDEGCVTEDTDGAEGQTRRAGAPVPAGPTDSGAPDSGAPWGGGDPADE